ncbi:MAG: gfo/Idh/MocA family oxidoreductase [Anaerolineaceae bacterium]|nr:gfo/Idh/MocA family oxidoreductase [Anaerolineaceae bacterium]
MSEVLSRVQPVRLGIAGLSHDHVHGVFRRPVQDDIEIVGMAEADSTLVERYHQKYGIKKAQVYADLDEMLDKTKPQVVAAFGSIYDHLAVVQACAPRGIHVMVEKPLAVSMEHARQMADLAHRYNIQVLTNYETTWYSSNHTAYQMVHDENQLGDIRKVVVHDGHWGPQEIGCSKEFLNWLTDPVLNGGGAVVDFGCYGANLITWLMDNQPPQSVTAVLQTLKPEIYPQVDDEATIIVTYEHAQGIIQGSWNWPIDRKDMEIYGETGYFVAVNRTDIRYRQRGDKTEQTRTLKPREAPFEEPFSWLAAVIREEITVPDNDLSSLSNNLVVVQILDAARESARTGTTVHF